MLESGRREGKGGRGPLSIGCSASPGSPECAASFLSPPPLNFLSNRTQVTVPSPGAHSLYGEVAEEYMPSYQGISHTLAMPHKGVQGHSPTAIPVPHGQSALPGFHLLW